MPSSRSLSAPVTMQGWIALPLFAAGLLALPALAQQPDPSAGQPATATEAPVAPGALPGSWTKALRWRNIGPATMGGRITSLSVYEADPSTYWVGTAAGGLLKTTNNGTTFVHQFDKESSCSVGAVSVAPSDSNVVWVGTGESNPRNSVSWGDGVYKSTDSGKTWKHMGLRETFQIGDVVIHPKDPNTVYVAALGRLWGKNKERGVFKTTDGGQTWNKVLYFDEKTGALDLILHPNEPENLLVAMWDRQRDGFDSHRGEPPLADGYDAYDPNRKWGPAAGIYKTTDGGNNWKKLAAGLPSTQFGRIGLDVYRKNPNTVFAVIDCEKIGMGTPPSRVYLGITGDSVEGGAKLNEVSPNTPAAKAGLKSGDLVTSVDGKPITNYAGLIGGIRGKRAGDKLPLVITRDGKSMEVTLTLEDRPAEPVPLARILAATTEDALETGVKINRVFPEGNADNAGIKEGDVIKEFKGKDVANVLALTPLLQALKPGDKAELTVIREGKSQKVTFRLAEGSLSGPNGSNARRPFAFMYAGQRPNVQDEQGPNSHEYGGIYRSDDFGETWKRLNSLNPRPMYFSQVRVDPTDDKNLYVMGVELYRSRDGGKTFTDDAGARVHSDHHAMWINPKDGRHIIVGGDGGFYVSYDRSNTWEHQNHAGVISQFYHVAVDTRTPYRVYGGLQDNGSWSGPSVSLSNPGQLNDDWLTIGGGDGFVCRVDPNDPDWVYWESQDGNIQRRNLKTGERGSIRPRRLPGMEPLRFNWNTPFLLSHYNSKLLYSAGNYVFRSFKQGDELRAISPVITRTGRGTATALSESPRNPDVLWVGTDDGALWVTRDGGLKWTDVTSKLGFKSPIWVSTIDASRFADGRAYVAFDAHRSDNEDPLVYVTEDFGQNWKSLRSNLPVGSTRTLREDLKNQNLLYCGTEFGAWASLNRGETWTSLNSNLPTVPVFELTQHPTAGEIVAATHGRGIWILDVTTLRQITPASMGTSAALYEPNAVVRWRSEPQKGSIYGNGHRLWIGQNPPRGAQIHYSLAQKATAVKLVVQDILGNTVQELQAPNVPGLNVVTWSLNRAQRRGPGGGPGGGGAGGGTGGGRRGGGAPMGGAPMGGTPMTGAPMAQPMGEGTAPTPPPTFTLGPQVPAGVYRVVLTVDGKVYVTSVKVENDPTIAPGQQAVPQPDAEVEEAEPAREKPRRILD